jgi:hypothetical protein
MKTLHHNVGFRLCLIEVIWVHKTFMATEVHQDVILRAGVHRVLIDIFERVKNMLDSAALSIFDSLARFYSCKATFAEYAYR